MPTAIEYGLTNHWHTQNGAGGGPPALTQNGAGTGPPNHHDATVAQLPFSPGMPSGEVLLAGPLVALLVVAAMVAAVRQRSRHAARTTSSR